MTEGAQVVVASTVGAFVGACVAYLCFTDEGRRRRRQLDAVLEDTVQELSRVRDTMVRAAAVASEGWKLVTEPLGEGADVPRYPRQSAPF